MAGADCSFLSWAVTSYGHDDLAELPDGLPMPMPMSTLNACRRSVSP
ncbi:hypothetical protein [Kitasatospora sp. NPDC085464]